jgi:ABC-type glycerol-3-phosphate transport system substrate-binding protein
MLNRLIQNGLYAACSLLVLANCAGQTAVEQPAIISPTETASHGTATQGIPLVTPTPSGPTVLTVWLPETLVPAADRDVAVDVSQQIAAFEASEPDIVIETRLKKTRDIGGIMETLRTASQVAPGALPDLTLMRREDLLTAVQSGFIQPLNERAYSGHLADLYPSAIELATANGALYGLPYAMEVPHLAYYEPDSTTLRWQFDDMLANNEMFVFAAGRNSGLNDVLLIQYLAAGGSAIDGRLGTINSNALRSTLNFYEQTVTAGLLTPALLDFTTPADFSAGLMDGSIQAAVITSTQYLTLLENLPDLQAGPIPTSSGEVTTLLDGWMWVIVTSNSDRQAAAARFLNWMMDVERQGHFAQITRLIPSQRDAVLRHWVTAEYAEFISSLMDHAAIPLSGGSGGVAARAIQSAFAAILEGQRTTDEAVDDVLDQVSS